MPAPHEFSKRTASEMPGPLVIFHYTWPSRCLTPRPAYPTTPTASSVGHSPRATLATNKPQPAECAAGVELASDSGPKPYEVVFRNLADHV